MTVNDIVSSNFWWSGSEFLETIELEKKRSVDQKPAEDCNIRELTSEELQDAEIHVNRFSQQNSCKEEYDAPTSSNVLSNKSKFMCLK